MWRKGFTLLELLIVVVILGILAAIALPQYTKTIMKARSAEAMTTVGTLKSSLERQWFEGYANGVYVQADFATGSVGDIRLDVDNPNADASGKWYYQLVDSGTVTTKSYLIGAQHRTSTEYWLKMDENGLITRSDALGGSGGAAGDF